MLDTLLPTTASPPQVPAPEPTPPPPPITSLELLQFALHHNHPELTPDLKLVVHRIIHQHWPQTLDAPVCTFVISDAPAQAPAVLHPR
jgi:hypothetical protein